jgi:hypothetical protein
MLPRISSAVLVNAPVTFTLFLLTGIGKIRSCQKSKQLQLWKTDSHSIS